jgi:hypothetical protein
VNIFLPRLFQHLQTQGLSKRRMPQHVLPFLKGRAFQLWQLQTTTLQTSKIVITWELFETFMKKTFGQIAPERQARLQYDKLTQTGSVFSYVTETKKLVQIMQPMPMICPGEAEVVNHFISKAKPTLQAWLTEHCPPNFWENSEQVFDQAIQFATNLASTTNARGNNMPPKVLGAMTTSNRHTGQRTGSNRRPRPAGAGPSLES